MADRAVPSVKYSLSFGSFRLLPAQQALLDGDKPVRIGSRALDILTALVERSGELVSKEDLVARAWPNTNVDEVSLRVHIAALRRALGRGQAGHQYLATTPGRGYRFVAPVVRIEEEPDISSQEAQDPPRDHNLPIPLTRLVGRSDIVNALAAQLARRRFITIVGAGGIGKTSVAVAVGDVLRQSYADGVRFMDLAPLAGPQLVLSALASVLGVPVLSENPLPALTAFLQGKHLLIVMDSCEHVIEAAAAAAENILRASAGVHILATSREPLRAEGERVQRLPPLGIPSASAGLTAAEALAFPAVQLFAERAAASLDGYELSDVDAPHVAEICRRLDGIALAIELAAGRIEAFGARALAAHLDDRLRLLAGGLRTAAPRHRTLTATLDWSYEYLPESERMILHRLSIFAGGFTLEAVRAVLAGAEIAVADVVDGVANLVAKSLVTAEVGDSDVRYRLLDTTRAYALEKLAASGEFAQCARRHAVYHRDLLERAQAEWETRPATEWLDAIGRQIDDVRSALDWAFSPTGDAAVAEALTVAAVPLWFQLSLMEECRERAKQALASLEHGERKDPRREMQLHAAVAAVLMNTAGAGADMSAAWTRVREIAEQLEDADYRLRALWGLWVDCRNRGGDYPRALVLAREFSDIAAGMANPADLSIADRMVGMTLHYLGDQAGARTHVERMLGRDVTPGHRSHIARFQFDQRVAARCMHALILLLQGFPDQAMDAAARNVDDAQATKHAVSLSYALAAGACPVALFIGDLTGAEHFVELLLDRTKTHGLGVWHVLGQFSKGMLLIKRGEVGTGLPVVQSALDELRKATFAPQYTSALGELAEALGRSGDITAGSAAIDEALALSERNEERWCASELLRIKGDLLLLEDKPGAAPEAEAHFRLSLEWARRQGALSWELRTGMSLARLRQRQRRTGEARDVLAPIYARFTEGFDTADLAMARRLLDEL